MSTNSKPINNKQLSGLHGHISLGSKSMTLIEVADILKVYNEISGDLNKVRHAPGSSDDHSATIGQLNAKIAEVVGAAPEALDSVREVVDYFQNADAEQQAALIALGDELGAKRTALLAATGLEEGAITYEDGLFGTGVIPNEPTALQALLALDVNLNNVLSNMGNRDVSQDGLSLDSSKTRYNEVVSSVKVANIGLPFGDGNIVREIIVNVTEAFSSNCGDLTIRSSTGDEIGVITEESLTDTDLSSTTITPAVHKVEGSLQVVAELEATCASGKAEVFVISLTV